MHKFLPNALGLLQKYKSSLKKKLPKDELKKNLAKLKLNRSLPRDEASLYRLLKCVADHLKDQTQAKSDNLRFSGSMQFLRDMQDLLKWHRLEKNHVIHASQEASRAMVVAIQLMILPDVKRTEKIAEQLDMYALKIAQYGIKEQQLAFLSSLEKFSKQDELFFSPLLERYQRYLEAYNPCLAVEGSQGASLKSKMGSPTTIEMTAE